MHELTAPYSQICDIFDQFLVGVITVSADRRIISANRAAQAIMGLKEQDLVGRSCHEVFGRELCGVECRFSDPVRTSAVERVPARERKPSGEPKICAGDSELEVCAGRFRNRSITKVVTPLYSPDGGPDGCIVALQDHSAFKDLIDRVRHEDRRLKIILDNLDLGILTVDRSGHITFFNNMAETITGYTRTEVLGRPFSKILGRSSGKELIQLKETISDGRARSVEEGELVTRDGRTIPIRTHQMALKHEDGRTLGGLITISDLSLMHQLNSAIKQQYTFYDMVGKDPAMQKVFDIIPVIAASDSTVLIMGPTGTGKDLVARIIHNLSKRLEKPLVTVNCAALPDNLLESEMFGYVKGAFTGADRDKPGRFQEADGGTIFLDEIGELPLPLQAKLLQVLETREFYPLGGRKTTRVNVRIIAATNQQLEAQVREKRFRQDLYYRLNVITLRLPELKERRADMPVLISHILNRLSARESGKVPKIAEDAMEALLCYDYPGNVRELENILEYAVIVCRGGVIELKHLPGRLQRYLTYEPPVEKPAVEPGREETDEKERILSVLKQNQWNRGETAKILNIDRTTLWRKMKKYRLF